MTILHRMWVEDTDFRSDIPVAHGPENPKAYPLPA